MNTRPFLPAPIILVLLGLPGSTTGDELSAQQLPTLTPDDYGQWERLGRATLSPDGLWLAVQVSRVNEENELRIRRTDSDSLVAVSFGTNATFSADGRWLAYTVGVSPDERERMAERDETPKTGLGLMDLIAGTVESMEAVASFTFSDDGRFLALKRIGSERDVGSNAMVRDMRSGSTITFGNVGVLAWQDDGHLLAMEVDAADDLGNGIRLYDAGSGRLSMLDAEDAAYTGLRWREDAADLAVLRVHPDEAWEDTAHVVLAWRGLDRSEPEVFELGVEAPSAAGTRVAEYRPIGWSDDGDRIFVGLQERVPAEETEEEETEEEEAEEEETEEEETGEEEDVAEVGSEEDEEDPPGVEIWHSLDLDPVPQQRVRENQLRRRTHVGSWNLESGDFLALGGDHADQVRVIAGGARLLAQDETPYDYDARFNQQRHDLYLVNTATGETSLVHEALATGASASPDGEYLLWFEGEDYWTYEIAGGEKRNVTAELPGTFVNLDVTPSREQMPSFGQGGWTVGDEAVLLYDEFDVWLVSADGSGGRRLTRGAEESVRHRPVRLDPEAEAWDTDEPLYFSLSGLWTKQSGFARLGDLDDDSPEVLLLEDASVGFLVKASDSDVFVHTRQRWEDSPDLFVTDADLDDARQVTRTNPFQTDYAWGRAELIDYENEWGRPLQGALIYPADYEPGRTYPLIVYHYEILSTSLHRYVAPDPENYYNTQVWSQEGYFVLMPDIVYRDRRPGQSNVETIRPAVVAALEAAPIDEERMGLIGHSWGGYQTTYFVTQDDLFASAVAGAPLTNLMSMYLSFYWNSGGTDARIFEISQGRMQVPWWEDWDSYHANSPVHHIETLNTPLLIEFGTDDGAVEFNQGVEFYNAARRADKHVVMLVYEGENHGLAQDPNRKDYASRILQWFGHYLKGEPAPDWISKGVPYIEQKDGLKKGRRIIG